VVVKRYHHPNPLLALFDRRRARSELEVLRAVERAGLPVPRALGLSAGAEGWELHLAPVPGARRLAELLGPREPPGGWSRLARALGALLARLHASGWQHADVHPGNVLVDGEGAPWLVDWKRARRAAPDEVQRIDELVLAAALGRETLPRRVRTRFLLAYLAALPPSLRPSSPAALLAATVEREAVARRRKLVVDGLGRWLRPSSRVCSIEHQGRPVLFSREVEPAALDALQDRTRTLLVHGPLRELEALWLAAARLHEHGLPVTPPLALARDRAKPWAAFALGAPASAGTETEEALCRVATLLVDRGLELADPLAAERLVAGPGGLLLRPPRGVRARPTA